MAFNYVALLPIPLLAPSVNLSIGSPAIGIECSFSGALALNASLSITPPTVALYLAALETIQASISAGISLNVPSCSFGVTVEAGLVAALALIAELELAFSLLVTLEGLLNASIGMYAFSYSGLGNGLGAALTTELATQWPDGAPTAGSCNALVFGAVSPIAQTQIQKFLNGLHVGAGLVYTAKMSAMSSLSLVTAAATAQGNAAIQYQLNAALQIKAAATANISFAPPSLSVTAEAIANFAINLKAQLALAPPSISVALSATANLAASLSAQFNLIIQLGLALNRFDAELFIYNYSGTGNTFGAAVTTALATQWGDNQTPTDSECFAVVLAATDSLTYGVMTGFFGGA